MYIDINYQFYQDIFKDHKKTNLRVFLKLNKTNIFQVYQINI